jgi:hypothetical protein
MSSVQGVKASLVNIQSIIDGELYGSISDGDYLSLVNVIKSVYDKNVKAAEESDEELLVEDMSSETQLWIIVLEQNSACLTIQNMWRKFKNKKQHSQDWIDKESEDIFGNMFEVDEKTWSLQYLEWAWKKMYRQHYGLGLFEFCKVPGDKISLSYWDFVSLSRGTHRL